MWVLRSSHTGVTVSRCSVVSLVSLDWNDKELKVPKKHPSIMGAYSCS